MSSALAVTALALLATSGCSKASEPMPAVPEAVVQAAAAAPAALPPAPLTVDTCAMLSQADAESFLGTLSAGPARGEPQGSLLGQCTYFGQKGSLDISARPAGEFDATVRYAGRKGTPVEPVAGLGEKAFGTQYGLMIQPAGKPYFLSVLALRGGKNDNALCARVAQKLKL